MELVNVKKRSKVNLKPQLRFSDFKDLWIKKRIDEITYRISDPVKVENDSLYKQIGIRSHGKGLFHKVHVDGRTIGNKRIFWVKENMFIVNIVFAWEQAVAKTTKAEIGMVASHRFPMYKPVEGQLELDFILRMFLTKKGKYLLLLASPGGAGRNKTLGQQTFNELKVNLPSFPEQQKIASFLSAIDKKIQQLTRKKELLEQYKKGVMQKLFSQEIRFKDENGKVYPDWEEKRLGDILIFISTNSLSRNDLNYNSGEIKNIHYGDIHTTFQMGFDVEKEKVPFINTGISLRKITEDQFCQVGDVVIADASEDYNDIGKSIEILNVGNERIVAGLHTFLARDTAGQTIKGFKGYLFQTWQVRKQIMKIAQGISVLGISKKNLSKVEFLLPCREEQRKITTLMQNIDKKVANASDQIIQTKNFKKGLLQQMFV